MNETDTEYNLRQYKLMLRSINNYEHGAIKLGSLVSDLDGLRCALQNPLESFLSGFESAWGKLEDVHAVMLDEGRISLNGNDVQLIMAATNELTKLINFEIAV